MSTETAINSWFPTVPSGECVQTRPSGEQWEEITCVYPWLRKALLVQPWEYEWQPEGFFRWMIRNWWFPWACVGVYLASIYLGQKYMEKREAWKWKNQLAAWNLFLAVFSCIGFTRTFPQAVHNISSYGFYNWLCMDPQYATGPGSTGVWIMFFVLSKIPELVDTFFVVIHKKKLLLLHWYHHASVLLCSWQTFTTLCPPGLVYCTMNFAVHGVMYTYYFLMAINKKPKWFNPKIITIAQILQMVVGTFVSACAFHAMTYSGCWAKFENNSATLAMYISYLALFVHFFFQRYGFSTSTKKAKTV